MGPESGGLSVEEDPPSAAEARFGTNVGLGGDGRPGGAGLRSGSAHAAPSRCPPTPNSSLVCLRRPWPCRASDRYNHRYQNGCRGRGTPRQVWECGRRSRSHGFELRGPQARAPAGPASATAVISTRPACQEGDAAGFILLIDTFLSHRTLCRLSPAPLSSPCFEENPSPAPGERKGEKPHEEQ